MPRRMPEPCEVEAAVLAVIDAAEANYEATGYRGPHTATYLMDIESGTSTRFDADGLRRAVYRLKARGVIRYMRRSGWKRKEPKEE